MRIIQPKMMEYIDWKLANNGLAQHSIETKNARQLFIEAAKCCVGIREVGGNNMGPMVELIQETIGRAEKEAWCMAFVQTLLAYTESKTGIQSPIPASEHCLTVWTMCPLVAKVKIFPLPGAIAIWQHGVTDQGHTGIFIEKDPNGNYFKAIEGNTEAGIDPNGKVERDGGGVYFTERSMFANGNMRLRGFLKPF